VSLNRVILSGRCSQYGPRITWTEQGKAQTSFTVVVEKGEFKTFIPVLCVGPKAEEVAETLQPDERLLIEGSLSYRKGRTKESGRLEVVVFDVERLGTHGATAGAPVESPN
jgi:single-stranded DNA-binding protein